MRRLWEGNFKIVRVMFGRVEICDRVDRYFDLGRKERQIASEVVITLLEK